MTAPPPPTADRAGSHARVRHPLFARFYARVAPAMEQQGMADHRGELLADLRGEVIEVGAGTGLNFAHYPSTVTRVVAVEPEPFLRAEARRAARGAPVPVEVVDGVAESLPAPDGSLDAAVCSLVLCSVRDPRGAVEELVRVLRPDGELRVFEHVLADTSGLSLLQRIVDATVWPHLFGGCHSARDTLSTLRDGGFEEVQLRRFRFPPRLPDPSAPVILGRLHRSPARGVPGGTGTPRPG